MTDTGLALAARLARCREGVASIVRESPVGQERADRFAGLLGQLVPRAEFTACLLNEAGSTPYAFRSQIGTNDSSQKSTLQSVLSSLDLSTQVVEMLPDDVLLGWRAFVSAIRCEDRPRGYLALGFSGSPGLEEVEEAVAVLAEASAAASLCATVQSLRSERDERRHFALLGQAFVGLSHELNNALNNMMLQTAVVQLQTGEQALAELSAIRQHGARAAGLLRSLHSAAHERQEEFYPVSANSVLAEILDEDGRFNGRVVPRFDPDAPPIRGTRATVQQLLVLIFEGVCSATREVVAARIARHEGGGTLTLALANVEEIDPADETPLLEALVWRNLDEIGVHAGKSLLRQLRCDASVERIGDNQFQIHLVWN